MELAVDLHRIAWNRCLCTQCVKTFVEGAAGVVRSSKLAGLGLHCRCKCLQVVPLNDSVQRLVLLDLQASSCFYTSLQMVRKRPSFSSRLHCIIPCACGVDPQEAQHGIGGGREVASLNRERRVLMLQTEAGFADLASCICLQVAVVHN